MLLFSLQPRRLIRFGRTPESELACTPKGARPFRRRRRHKLRVRVADTAAHTQNSAVVMATNSEILVHAAAVGESSSRASQRRLTFSCHPHTQGVGTTAMTSFKCGDSRSPKYSPIRPGSYALARRPHALLTLFPARVGLRLYFRVCNRPISGGSLAALIDRNP